MSYSLTFTLVGLPKRPNQGGAKGKSWFAYSREAKRWRQAVVAAVGLNGPAAPLNQAHLTITRFSSVCPDYDALVASAKHVVDGLIDAGVIVDDNMSVIGVPSFKWEKAKPGHGSIRVEVTG